MGDVESAMTFLEGIGYESCYVMTQHGRSIHSWPVRQGRDGRQPSALFVEANVRLDEILLPGGIDQQQERMKRAVTAPKATARVETTSPGRMDLLIRGAVVAVLFTDVNNSNLRSVQGSVEDSALFFASSSYGDAPE